MFASQIGATLGAKLGLYNYGVYFQTEVSYFDYATSRRIVAISGFCVGLVDVMQRLSKPSLAIALEINRRTSPKANSVLCLVVYRRAGV